MCIECRSSSKVLEQYWTETIETRNFEFHLYNTVNIVHLIPALAHTEGIVNFVLASKILKEFSIWYKKKRKDNYLPETGIEQMYSQQCLKELDVLSQKYLPTEKTSSDDRQEEMWKHLRSWQEKTPQKPFSQQHLREKHLVDPRDLSVDFMIGMIVGSLTVWGLSWCVKLII